MEDMCTGCLSTDRKLFFIGETGYYHLYSQILNEIPVYDLSQVCVRICWECRARLRAMEVFKQQVKQNYCNLMQHIPPQAASKLSSQSAFILSYPELTPDPEVKLELKKEHCEEPFASALDLPENIGHSDSDNVKEQTIKRKRKPKIKLKTSNNIKVKKKRKKQEIDKLIEVDNLDINSIDNNIEGNDSLVKDVNSEENIEDTEKSLKRKKKPKIKLKTSNNIKVKKKRKKNIIDKLIYEDDDIDNNIGDSVNIEDSLIKDANTEENIEEDNLNVSKRTRNTSPLPERPQCQECGKVFSSKKTYRYHLNVLHKGQNKYPCPRCGKVYQWKSNLGRHLRSHRAVDDGELHCELCNKSFASVATYRQHLRISRRHVPEAEFSFACEACGKRFVNKTRLRDHIDWDHLNRIKFRCQLCDKPFKCHTSLYVHTQNVHVGKERKENLCHVCGKSYQNAAKLKYHITAMHSGETPHRCTACGAAFGWYSSLYRHMREVHHKMKGVAKKGKKLKQIRASPIDTHYVPL